jgi:hypothetical protein
MTPFLKNISRTIQYIAMNLKYYVFYLEYSNHPTTAGITRLTGGVAVVQVFLETQSHVCDTHFL